jgi:hypothetical protein
LQRQVPEGAEFHLGVPIKFGPHSITAPILATTKDGQKLIIALSGALTGDHPADGRIAEYRDSGGEHTVVIENELVVRGNLPAATRDVRQRLGV